MPWQECNLMDERLKFIAGLLDGEKMAVMCRRFGVSRKTGYKILDRYNSCGRSQPSTKLLRSRHAIAQNSHLRCKSVDQPLCCRTWRRLDSPNRLQRIQRI